jgi:NADH dehydrogenase
MGQERILVTGANGFVGKYMVRELLSRDYEVVCFIQPGTSEEPLSGLDIELKWGDLRDKDSLIPAVAGAQAVIHLAAAVAVPDPRTNFEVNVTGVQHLMDVCKLNDVERVIAYSSISAKRQRAGAYAHSKKQSESILSDSQAHVTIFRPDLIYGNGSGGLRKIIKQVKAYPLFIPMVGKGEIIRQPVYVRDIVKLTADVIPNPTSFNKAFDVGGETPIRFRELVLMIADEFGVNKTIFPIPRWTAKLVAYALEEISPNPAFTSDNVLGLIESTDFDAAATIRELSFTPTPLRAGLKRAIHELSKDIV